MSEGLSFCSSEMPVERVANNQQCFTTSRALLRITEQLPTWQSICQLPGGIGQSWLVQLEGGCFQCVACHYQRSKMTCSSLSREEGMAAGRWTRLQTFRQHHMGKSRTFNAISFVRDTHPEVALDSIASPIEDFRDLPQNIKQIKLKMCEGYGKREKLRKMM